MRNVVAVAVLCIAACTSEKLERGPPAGVDFSGHWKLNEADSDEPQRLIQAPIDGPGQGGSNGGGSQGGRQGGGRGGPGGMGYGIPGGPIMPSLGALAAGLRWPGKQLEIKQVGAVVAFTSDGNNVVCQPMEGGQPHPHEAAHGAAHGTHSPSREMPPPRCGWIEKTLIVKSGDPEDGPPFEQHFSLSEDGRRLVEVVDFKGGRSTGFTVSRVWDRIG